MKDMLLLGDRPTINWLQYRCEEVARLTAKYSFAVLDVVHNSFSRAERHSFKSLFVSVIRLDDCSLDKLAADFASYNSTLTFNEFASVGYAAGNGISFASLQKPLLGLAERLGMSEANSIRFALGGRPIGIFRKARIDKTFTLTA